MIARKSREEKPIHLRPQVARSLRALALGLVSLGAAASGADLTLAAEAPAAGTPAAQAVRTLAQDQRGATFEVVPGPARFDTINVNGVVYARVAIRGASVLERPGYPALPTLSLHVAVPEGMSPRLRVTAEEWEDRAAPAPVPVSQERFVGSDPKAAPVSEFRTIPDEAVYRGASVYPATSALVGAGALVGEWWVVPVQVRPVRWDPRAATYRLLRRMTLRVDFVPATEHELRLRPVTRPGAQARPWDRVQRGLVKNYEAARAFPARPRAGAIGTSPNRSSSLGRALLAVNPEWKLSVAQSGWVSVSYATLASTGFPSGLSIADVRVEERGYDDAGDSATATAIPVVARDNNSNGTFDAGDAITFYARHLRDRVGLASIENRYAEANVYWLTWGSAPVPVPGTISGSIGGAATIPTSFRDVIRLDVNRFIHPWPKMAPSAPYEAVEYYFWTNGNEPDFQTPIPFRDPDPTQPFRIRARYQGVINRVHYLDLFFDGASGVTDTLSLNETFFNQDVLVFDSGFTIPGSHIGGANRYRYVGRNETLSGAGPFASSAALFDVVEATYSRLYTAASNVLRFTSGGSGSIFEPHIGGFTSSAIEVYDVTNPLAPLRVTGAVVSPSGAGYEVVFRTDATSGERRFVALVPGSETAIAAADVVQDVPSNLRVPSPFGSSNVARALLIAPEEFSAPAARLADFRRAQGYVVEVAFVQDIYDEFNGGVKSARALRRYLRHAYLAWSPRPTYAVLAGDGSLDYEHVNAASGADWVPTYMKFETILGPPGFELVAHDSYYHLNLNLPEPTDGDFVPSLFLGRIPASNAGELDAFVTKMIQYEDFQATDTWRGRQLLVSDDEYSSTILFNAGYCFQSQEFRFKTANQYMASAAASGVGTEDLRSDFFDLKTYTDQIGPNCQVSNPNCRDERCVSTALRAPGGAVSQLHEQLATGALILNFEAHANRYLIAHEFIFCSSSLGGGCPSSDYDLIANYNKPAYLMVWGCHSNQFPDGPIGDLGLLDSTDAQGEQWMMLPNRGSIASFGSTGYEYLETNATYNEYVADAFFRTPPSPDPPPGEPRQARWILGEVMGEAAVRNALTGDFFHQVMNRTEHLLGDPMLRMDALAPRVFNVTVGGNPFIDNAPLTTDSPTDSLPLLAQLRDEVGIDSVFLTERDLIGGAVTPIDPGTYSVSFSDSSRLATLTGAIRPRVGNYDVEIRAVDINGRLRVFTLQVRTPIRYLANGVEILDNVFVEGGARLRAEVTSPIPLTADSLDLVLDGVVIPSTKTKLDTAGRRWALESLSGDRSPGTHTIQVAIGGRTAGLDQRTFQISNEFKLRGVAVVDPRVLGAGCGGSVLQYELSAGASKVELQIFSVSGRRVATFDLPGVAGLNVYCWDGRDGRAHDTAQGVYIYRLRATDPNGRTVSREGRMIRVR